MKNLKNNKGITLVALIITIIVMLILVGVTIKIIKDGGLIDVTKDATERYKTAAKEESEFDIDVSDIYGMTEEEKEAWDSGADDGVKADEDLFIWASKDPADGDLFGTIVGYNYSMLGQLTELKIPSRCVAIDGEYNYYHFEESSTSIPTKISNSTTNKKYVENITSVKIPKSVQKIRAAFPYFGLKSIDLPSSITYIGQDTFKDCTSLTTITVNGENITSSSNNIQYIAGGAFDSTGWFGTQPAGEIYIGKVLYKYKGEMPASYTCTVKDGTISIASHAFYNSTTGDSGSVSSNLDSLVAVNIPSSVCFIDSGAFYRCTNLETISGDLSNITYVGGNNFASAADSSISSGSWSSKWYTNQLDGEVYIGKVLYKYKGEIPTSYACTVKDGTRTISDYAFYSATSSNLTSVVMPNTVEVINPYAFYKCTSLAEVKMPDNIIHIGSFAFANCSSLTSIEFSENAFKECANDITDFDYIAGSIDHCSFVNCTALESVTIPDGVYVYINPSAFRYCHESLKAPSTLVAAPDI